MTHYGRPTIVVEDGDYRKNGELFLRHCDEGQPLDLPEAEKYKVLAVDAFSSDAIPIHLITKEAVALYLRQMRADGILAFHISNRYLDLRPVLANLAADASLAAVIEHDDEKKDVGKFATTWVLLARNEKAFGALADDIKQESGDDGHRKYGLFTELGTP